MKAVDIAEWVLLGMYVGFIPQAISWAAGKLMSLLNSVK